MTKTDDLQKIIAALTMARDCIDPLTATLLTFSTIDDAISSASALSALPQQEPVAWMFHGEGWGREVMLSEKEALDRKARLSATWDITITPLFASPISSPSEVESKEPLELGITKEWFEKRAALEGDHEISAMNPEYLPGFVPSAADRHYAHIASGLLKEIEALKQERDSLVHANHSQAYCIQQCAAIIGPETSGTIDGLPKAVKHLVSRAEAAEAKLSESDHG